MAARRPFPIAILVTLAMIGGGGCVSSQEAGKPFPSSARHELVVSRTTKAEAQKLLGPPLTASAAEGKERWAYEHTRVSARQLIPFVGDTTISQTPYEQLFLTFQAGVLAECVYVAETYRTEGRLIVPAATVREPCGLGGGSKQ